jgi:uncharacterized protein (TIGR01777 family)
MKVLITGGTGFIGSALCETLIQHGHELLVVSRQAPRQAPSSRQTFLLWDAPEWTRSAQDVEAVINLAGESIAEKRWSPQQKALIRDSRLGATRRLVEAMRSWPKPPSVFVNASAIGYYGPRGDEQLTEADEGGAGFLAEVCRAWEAEALQAEALGVRVVRLRIGLVLGLGGGILSKMVPPFRWFVGGPLGTGRQWMSWIHRDDVIGLIEWAVKTPLIRGAVNATAPEPVTMREFCRCLGQVLRRPSWAPVPPFILRALLGDMAEMVLTGQRVIPHVALQRNYLFCHPTLPAALRTCL